MWLVSELSRVLATESFENVLMLLKKKYLENIGFKLAQLKAYVETFGAIHFFDLNVVAEDFFADLLNEVYGYFLVNLNHSDLNNVAVDLGDKSRRIAIQVTSERTKSKIQKTVDKFAQHGLKKDYDILKVAIIGDRTGKYENLKIPDSVSFSGINDVIDINSLMRKMSTLDEPRLKKIVDLIRQKTFDYPLDIESASPLSRIQRQSVEDLSRQRRVIGDGLVIERTGLVEEIIGQLSTGPKTGLVLVGESGSGKSSVAASVAEQYSDEGTTLFLSLSSVIELSKASNAEINFTLATALGQLQGEGNLVLIDGIDRAQTREQFQALAKFIREVVQCDKCQLMLSCQQEHFNRVVQRLIDNNCDISRMPRQAVDGFSKENIAKVVEAIPSLRTLLTRPNLPSLYKRPFIIDALARATNSIDKLKDKPVGESHLIEWVWEFRFAEAMKTRVRKVLVQIATHQADSAELSTSDTNVEDGDAVDRAIEDSFLVRECGKLKFSHDMYGDWARQRHFLGLGDQLANELDKRSSNPVWHRAIRLVGIHLLEQHDNAAEWKQVLEQCHSAQDLLLDGILFSAEPLRLLNSVSDILLQDDCMILCRLVQRALVVITVPRLFLEKLTNAGQQISPHLRVFKRDPRPYQFAFGALLKFLGRNIHIAKKSMPLETCRAAKSWLELTATNWPHRDVAAEIAIEIGKELLHCGGWQPDDDKSAVECFQALLYAYEQKQDDAERHSGT